MSWRKNLFSDPADKSPAVQRVLLDLKRQVLSGKLKPGAVLPTVRELADRHGIALMTAHQAFRQAKSEGWAQRRGRRLRVLPGAEHAIRSRAKQDSPAVIYMLNSTLGRIGDAVEMAEYAAGFCSVFPDCSLRHVLVDVSEGPRVIENLLKECAATSCEVGFVLSNMPSAFKRLLATYGVPCVVDGFVEPDVGLPCVFQDMVSVGRQAGELLYRSGGRAIAVATEELVGGEMFLIEGFRQAAEKLGHTGPAAEEFYCRLPSDPDACGRVVKFLLSRPDRPTGVFTIHPEFAFPVIHEALGAGIRVPEDLQIVGFRHHPFYQWCRPQMTSIGVPSVPDLARQCAELLAQAMAHVPGTAPRQESPTTLIERESTLPRNDAC